MTKGTYNFKWSEYKALRVLQDQAVVTKDHLIAPYLSPRLFNDEEREAIQWLVTECGYTYQPKPIHPPALDSNQ